MIAAISASMDNSAMNQRKSEEQRPVGSKAASRTARRSFFAAAQLVHDSLQWPHRSSSSSEAIARGGYVILPYLSDKPARESLARAVLRKDHPIEARFARDRAPCTPSNIMRSTANRRHPLRTLSAA